MKPRHFFGVTAAGFPLSKNKIAPVYMKRRRDGRQADVHVLVVCSPTPPFYATPLHPSSPTITGNKTITARISLQHWPSMDRLDELQAAAAAAATAAATTAQTREDDKPSKTRNSRNNSSSSDAGGKHSRSHTWPAPATPTQATPPPSVMEVEVAASPPPLPPLESRTASPCASPTQEKSKAKAANKEKRRGSKSGTGTGGGGSDGAAPVAEASPPLIRLPTIDDHSTLFAIMDCLRDVKNQLSFVSECEATQRTVALTLSGGRGRGACPATVTRGGGDGRGGGGGGYSPAMMLPTMNEGSILEAFRMAQSRLLTAYRLRPLYWDETRQLRDCLARSDKAATAAAAAVVVVVASTGPATTTDGDERVHDNNATARAASDAPPPAAAGGGVVDDAASSSPLAQLRRRVIHREAKAAELDGELAHFLERLWSAEAHHRSTLVRDVARQLRVRIVANGGGGGGGGAKRKATRGSFVATTTATTVVAASRSAMPNNGTSGSSGTTPGTQHKHNNPPAAFKYRDLDAELDGTDKPTTTTTAAGAVDSDGVLQHRIDSRTTDGLDGTPPNLNTINKHSDDDDGDEMAGRSDEELYQLAERLIVRAQRVRSNRAGAAVLLTPPPFSPHDANNASGNGSDNRNSSGGDHRLSDLFGSNGGADDDGEGLTVCYDTQVFSLASHELASAVETRDAILAIEARLQQLYLLFSDVNVLVRSQGEQLDAVVVSAQEARERMATARGELKRAKHYKRSCGCGCCCAVM